MDATAAAADQQAVLDQLAGELRETVDALAAQVPEVQRRDLTGDSAAACSVGADDDGTQQWIYGVRLVYDADPEAVAKAARDLLTQRGFTLRRAWRGAGREPLHRLRRQQRLRRSGRHRQPHRPPVRSDSRRPRPSPSPNVVPVPGTPQAPRGRH
jgi:hypothetical protein